MPETRRNVPGDGPERGAGRGAPGPQQRRETGWTPPCPPSGTQHYHFTVYAPSGPPDVADGAAPDEAVAAVRRVATAQGTLNGTVTSG